MSALLRQLEGFGWWGPGKGERVLTFDKPLGSGNSAPYLRATLRPDDVEGDIVLSVELCGVPHQPTAAMSADDVPVDQRELMRREYCLLFCGDREADWPRLITAEIASVTV